MTISHRTYQYAASGAVTRERIKRAGHVNGYPLWTPEEDDLLRRHYVSPHDFKDLLPHRTVEAVKQRAQRLGIQRRVHVWTTSEVAKLKRLWPQASKSELLEAFPNCSIGAITVQANNRKFYRKKRPLPSSGLEFIDSIRERRDFLNYTKKDLDALAGTGSYFQKRYWRNLRRPSAAVLKAVYAMGGRVTIHWDD